MTNIPNIDAFVILFQSVKRKDLADKLDLSKSQLSKKFPKEIVEDRNAFEQNLLELPYSLILKLTSVLYQENIVTQPLEQQMIEEQHLPQQDSSAPLPIIVPSEITEITNAVMNESDDLMSSTSDLTNCTEHLDEMIQHVPQHLLIKFGYDVESRFLNNKGVIKDTQHLSQTGYLVTPDVFNELDETYTTI